MKYTRENQVWDYYWDSHKKSSRKIYDFIASFYRTYIIKKSLNYFIRKYFAEKSIVLHAGCGSGQVDVDINDYLSIVPLDISIKALSLYDKANARQTNNKIQGDIFHLPFSDATFNGIYNLGVMEHFTEEDIQKILHEFRRVLKDSGRIILFWPPEFGLSVIFFKVLVFVFKKILLKKDIKFHPDEVSRIKSKRHLYAILDRSNFRVIQYYFGFRDLFTYTVVVIRKA